MVLRLSSENLRSETMSAITHRLIAPRKISEPTAAITITSVW